MGETGITSRTSVFETPWFQLIEKSVGQDHAKHYSISTQDYVSVFAVTRDGTFPLVRQFRPAVEEFTLELPSGHVDEGETPEQSARKELLEETGFVAGELVLLGELSPDTGRLGNRMWCFFAAQAERPPESNFTPPVGIAPVVYEKTLRELLLETTAFPSALNRATILMAIARGFVEL